MTSRPRNALCIVCTDQRRTFEFYRDAFGADPIPGEVGTCTWLRIGELPITLLANTDHPSRLDFCEHAMATIFLQSDDIHSAYERAIAHGARTIDPLQPDGVNFIVADPDGIIIEVMQFETNPK
jgi:catechol 2,3-dioxygenase-like lactoylglutathione lyase family enzyme